MNLVKIYYQGYCVHEVDEDTVDESIDLAVDYINHCVENEGHERKDYYYEV